MKPDIPSIHDIPRSPQSPQGPQNIDPLHIVFLGLSITSSWGNGHATTYRALVRELAARGHAVTFLERDVPWYADNRDLPRPPWGRTALYASLDELRDRFAATVREADVVILGSYVPDGVAVGRWVLDTAHGLVAFYDIDTPVTAAKLARGDHEYLAPDQVPRFDLYLSFTGGPMLDRLVRRWGARAARPLYCSCDPTLHRPPAVPVETRWDLGYLGTYSIDRQPALERLLLEPARRLPRRRFAVAGPMYPEGTAWPPNVTRLTHVSPPEHRGFYAAQRYTLNLTRAAMLAAGWSPSVRLFEAAACGVPIVTDPWPGLETFFLPDREILVARSTEEMMAILLGHGHGRRVSEEERRLVGERGRARVLASHTAAHRAAALEGYILEAREQDRRRAPARLAAAARPHRRT